MFDVTDKGLAILFSFLMFAQAYCLRLIVGTYIFPAALFSLAWFFYTFIPLVVLFDVPVNPVSILYIVACVSAFSLGALPFNWRRAFNANKLKTSTDVAMFDSKLMQYLFYGSSLCSIIFSTVSVVSNNVDLSSLIFDLVETSARYAAMRGKGELEYNVWGILSTFFTYATPIMGGLVYRHNSGVARKWAYFFITFAPSTYYMLTQSAKLIMFFSIGFYCASVLLKKIYAKKLGIFSWSFVFKIFALCFLFFPLLLVSFISREGFFEFRGSEELSARLFFSLNSYAFGQLYAFSDFFSSYLGASAESIYVHDFNSYGYYTFKSIFDFLGGDKYFPPGTFHDGYFYGDTVATNIYTIFRGLIYDYGGFGAMVFMFLTGLFAHAFFHRLLRKRDSWMACGVFLITIVFIQGTYLFSIFMARYMYLLLVSFVFIFWLNEKYCVQRNLRARLSKAQ